MKIVIFKHTHYEPLKKFKLNKLNKVNEVCKALGHNEHKIMQFEFIPLNQGDTIMGIIKQQIRIIWTMLEHRIFRRKR